MTHTDAVVSGPALWREAFGAIRSNFLPGLFLWGLAALIVALYYAAPGCQPVFDRISEWKTSGGYLFSFCSTAVFAGLIPFLYMKAMPATRQAVTGGTLVFLMVFWAYRGVEVDAFYRLQGLVFGTANDPLTVAAKVAMDMFVYNLVWATSVQLLAYHWMNGGFRADTFRAYPWKDFFGRRFPVAMLSVWAVWLPVLAFVYSLPSALQIPLFNLAACFCALVMATLTAKSQPRSMTSQTIYAS